MSRSGVNAALLPRLPCALFFGRSFFKFLVAKRGHLRSLFLCERLAFVRGTYQYAHQKIRRFAI